MIRNKSEALEYIEEMIIVSKKYDQAVRVLHKKMNDIDDEIERFRNTFNVSDSDMEEIYNNQ